MKQSGLTRLTEELQSCKQQKLTSHCLAQLSACATQLGKENACSCPSSSLLKHQTELWSKMLNWINFHCASSAIQQWGSCRGSSAVPHTNACSSDNVCIVCPLHCGALWHDVCLTPSHAGWHYRPSRNISPTFLMCSLKVLSRFNFLVFLTVRYNLCRKGWTGRNRQWNTMQEDAKSVKTPTLSTHNQCQL